MNAVMFNAFQDELQKIALAAPGGFTPGVLGQMGVSKPPTTANKPMAVRAPTPRSSMNVGGNFRMRSQRALAKGGVPSPTPAPKPVTAPMG